MTLFARMMGGLLSLGVLLAAVMVSAYPTDKAAQDYSKIRRLVWQQHVNDGLRRGRTLPNGAHWPMRHIQLRMLQNKKFDVTADTPKDAFLQEGLEKIMKKWSFRRYAIALLDISNPKKPLYAAVDPTYQQTPGSTAKVLVGAGLFNALKQRFPNNIEKRRKMLQEVLVPADDWAQPNHHEIPVPYGDVYEGADAYKMWVRRVHNGDTFSLWEWVDHALSPSSNSAATMTWREATLINLLGEAYPPEKRDNAFFSQWERAKLTDAVFETVAKPVRDADLGDEDFYVRMFFTRGGGKHISSKSSRGSPYGMLRWLLRMEQGRMVDEWSSLELKKLLYLTRRRTRYAYSKALNSSATFFKTGSLYKCDRSTMPNCGKYRGNVVNVLNGMIVVETMPEPEAPGGQEQKQNDKKPPAKAPETKIAQATPQSSEPVLERAGPPAPAPKPEHVYIVGVMSNELRRNAAFDHAVLATAIHELIKERKQQGAVPKAVESK